MEDGLVGRAFQLTVTLVLNTSAIMGLGVGLVKVEVEAGVVKA